MKENLLINKLRKIFPREERENTPEAEVTELCPELRFFETKNVPMNIIGREAQRGDEAQLSASDEEVVIIEVRRLINNDYVTTLCCSYIKKEDPAGKTYCLYGKNDPSLGRRRICGYEDCFKSIYYQVPKVRLD